MDWTNMALAGVGIPAILAALLELAKRAGWLPDNRWMVVCVVLIAVGLTELTWSLQFIPWLRGPVEAAVGGLMLALSSMGVYSGSVAGAKIVAGGPPILPPPGTSGPTPGINVTIPPAA